MTNGDIFIRLYKPFKVITQKTRGTISVYMTQEEYLGNDTPLIFPTYIWYSKQIIRELLNI